MKKIRPEQGCLIHESAALSCCNVQILLIRCKHGAGAAGIWGGCWQIDNMKHKYQLHVPNCQISNSSQIVIN